MTPMPSTNRAFVAVPVFKMTAVASRREVEPVLCEALENTISSL
jgi:hypothetical protein